MLEDEQVKQLLLMNGVCDEATISSLCAEAQGSDRTLYDMVVARGVMLEEQFIQMIGPLVGFGAVLLKGFQGDAMLMSLAPVDLLKREGMLPVGIQEVDGRRSLLVAMANPLNVNGLKALRKFTSLPLVPLLAGPMDLLGAIERCESNYLGGPDDDLIENADVIDEEPVTVDNLRFTRDSELVFSGDSPVIDEMMSGFAASHPSGVLSALSLIDDIPRDRHSAATPSGGSAAVAPRPASPATGAPPPVHEPHAPHNLELSDLFPAVGSMLRGDAGSSNKQTVEFELGPSLKAAATSGIVGGVSDEGEVSGLESDASVDGLVGTPERARTAHMTGFGRPTAGASGSFMRVPRAAEVVSGAEMDEDPGTLAAIESHPQLPVALFRLLQRRGMLSAAEVKAELDRLKP
jgi:hypothetical protein